MGSRTRNLTVAFALLLLIAACTGPSGPNDPAVTGTHGEPPLTETTAGVVTSFTTALSSQDLSVRPLVWFTPLPPRVKHMGYDGSDDYFDLFALDAAWSVAAERVHVFKIYSSWVHNYATDDELRRVVSGVASLGLALALEMGPFLPTSECGSGVEGFDGTMEIVRRVQDAGGTLQVVAFDEPFAFAHFWDGPNACHWPIERVAQEAADFVRMLREVAPGVIVGDIEPMWTVPEITADDIAAWLDAYQEAAAEPLGFLHLDADWERLDWPEVLLATEQVARGRGVPIGVIYNGGDAESDEGWSELAVDRMYTYEEVWGGRPDHVVFQSWMDHPDRVLPETDPTTFTGLINRYFGARSAIRVDGLTSPGPGRLVLDGALATMSDRLPVANGSVVVEATPLDGSYQLLRLDGRVPAEATSAVVGLRVNTEEAGPGIADMTVYEVAYSEGGETTNRVPNPQFGGALDGWGVAGDGAASTGASDLGSGEMLRVIATPDQRLSINSAAFAVTPGAEYHFSVAARIPEASIGSGYISVIFLNSTEVVRHKLDLAPAAIPLGQVLTEQLGSFRLAQDGLEPGRYRLRISYRGDASHWPTHAEQELEVG